MAEERVQKLLDKLPKLESYIQDLDFEVEGICHMPDGQNAKEVHSLSEARMLWESLDLNDVDVLCIYGFTPFLYDLSKEWLRASQSRKLVIIDDRPEAFFLALHQGCENLLDDLQLELHFFESLLEMEPLMKKIAWNHIFLHLHFAALSSLDSEKRSYVKQQFDRISLGVHLVASDYSDRGRLVMENVYFNCSSVGSFRNASALKGCFEKIPAIICGSGPSLDRHQGLLGEMEDRALVFVGGSALGKMKGSPPHFAAAIDKQAPYHLHKLHAVFEAPFFYQNRMSKDNFSLIHTDKFLVGDNGGYPLEQWLCEQLGMDLFPFEGGWNVGTLLIQLAEYFGCDPIILVGMDLSVQEKTASLKVKDLFGRPVYTQRDWLMAAKWIEEFAKRCKARLINATEGGIGFGGVDNVSFETVQKEILKRSYDLWGLCHAQLKQIETRQVHHALMKENIAQIEQSLVSLVDICTDHLDELQDCYSKREFNKSLSLEEKMEKEMAYHTLLDPLWNIWKYFFVRESKKNQKIPHQFQLVLHQTLFFQSTLDMHLSLIEKWKERNLGV